MAAIDDFLAQEQEKELLRFSTAGSVDDGKSTLIGRLLYDSKGVYEDTLAAVKKASVNRSAGPIDFSLLTDGLKAEREQGITIDVAYRYFSTPKRKFIIADTPGHEQYTRNMATGASTATLSIVLVDARKGVLPQSRRHTYIAALLGIPHIVIAVNKMDLVDFSHEVFQRIEADFRAFTAGLPVRAMHFLPVSALDGDNVVTRSERTPWYKGPHLLELLETIPVADSGDVHGLRFPVQHVIRPSLDFRGYAGQMAAGTVRVGETVLALPSGRSSRVKQISTYDGDLPEAYPPLSVTICLDDELDIGRGDMLVTPGDLPHVSRRFDARVVWMHSVPMEPGKSYLLKHTTQQVPATVTALRHRVNIDTMIEEPARQLELNEIGLISVETTRPLFFDAYQRNRATGGFILIDPVTNLTVGAGMIEERVSEVTLANLALEQSRLTPAERAVRSGHQPAIVWLTARLKLAYLLERELYERGCQVTVLADDIESHLLPEVARVLQASGLIVICSGASNADLDRVRALTGGSRLVAPPPESLSNKDYEAVEQICRMLEERSLIRRNLSNTGGDGI